MFTTGFAAVAVADERLAAHRPRILAKPFHLRHLIAEIDALMFAKARAIARRKPMSKTLAVVAALLLVAIGAAAQSGSVEIRDAWARATPGKADIGAAYLTLQSPVGDRLTGLSTPIASITQLHTTTMEGGVKKMTRVAALDLPAGQKIKLEPGGMHIMLIGLTDRLRQGQSFPLTLSFEKAGKREVTVSVESAGSMGPEETTSDDMKMPMPAGH